MAVRLNCGEVQPYASMWGPTDLGQMGEAVVLEAVHQHPLQWNAKKYMFCGLTNTEYNLCRADDGTVHRTDHSGHNTGFTSWHCSMHDCITYMLWCIMSGVVQYMDDFVIVAFVPNMYKLVTQIYHGWSRGFNRGFQSLMVQGNPYNFDVTEHGTQRTLRVHVNWALILSTYSFENGFVWNQYIPMNIREHLDSPGTDPRHAGLSMVLYNHGVSFSRFLPEPLKSDLLTYSERFRVRITKDWDEGSNLASTAARNKLVKLRLASTHGGTDGMAAGTTAASEATHGAAATGS